MVNYSSRLADVWVFNSLDVRKRFEQVKKYIVSHNGRLPRYRSLAYPTASISKRSAIPKSKVGT